MDDRFFFNKAMVEELIAIGDQKLDAWITPFIQVRRTMNVEAVFFPR